MNILNHQPGVHWDARHCDSLLTRGALAQSGWRRRTVVARCEILREAAHKLRQNKDALAALVTREMGKPIREALGEVEKCAVGLDYYADNAVAMLAAEPVEVSSGTAFVTYEPIGLVLAVMPWNYPLWQVIRFAAPALAAGNGVILKHASIVPGCAAAIEDVFAAAGAPSGLFQSLLLEGAGSRQAVADLIADPRIAAVTMTGSDTAGATIGQVAGLHLKKCVLELGGSDPFVVLADADLALAAKSAVAARFGNAGQSCISAKRFLVAREVAAKFEQQFAAAAGALRIGDPLDPATDIGRLARPDLVDALVRQVSQSLDMGARLVIGGERLDDDIYAPTILADVMPQMPVFAEETFGPVAAITPFDTVEEAVALANDTVFGLGASVWSQDMATATSVADAIESGCVFINAVVASDARLPFGGVKRSGYGRELSAIGMHEFTNIRTRLIGAFGQ